MPEQIAEISGRQQPRLEKPIFPVGLSKTLTRELELATGNNWSEKWKGFEGKKNDWEIRGFQKPFEYKTAHEYGIQRKEGMEWEARRVTQSAGKRLIEILHIVPVPTETKHGHGLVNEIKYIRIKDSGPEHDETTEAEGVVYGINEDGSFTIIPMRYNPNVWDEFAPSPKYEGGWIHGRGGTYFEDSAPRAQALQGYLHKQFIGDGTSDFPDELTSQSQQKQDNRNFRASSQP